MKGLWKVFFCFCFVCALLLTSCQTSHPTVDLDEAFNPVLQLRPDNTKLEVYAGPIYEVPQVISNMHTYLYAWEMWQAYAESLEQSIEALRTQLSE